MNQSAAGILHACETWLWAALACAVLIIVGVCTAQGGVEVWTKHGLYGRGVTALVIDPHIPSTLYAATSGGVFESTNSGCVVLAAAVAMLAGWLAARRALREPVLDTLRYE